MNTPGVRETIEGVKSLPTLPTVLAQILAAAADPEASALDLTRLISADQTLSATLLKVVNSAYYGMARRIDSITQAIVLLGFFEVRNIALAVTAFRSFSGSSSDFDRGQLWRHSLATAIAAERLAKALHLECGSSCFVAGLLHDIGKVAFDALYPTHFRRAAHQAHEEGILVRDAERVHLGMDHAEAGALLGEHWNLPAGTVECIRLHHSQCVASSRSSSTAAVVAAADYVTYLVELGELSNGRLPDAPVPEVLPGWSDELSATLSAELTQARGRIDEFIGAIG